MATIATYAGSANEAIGVGEGATNGLRGAQSFLTGIAGELETVKITGWKIGSPTDNLYVKIYAYGDGTPENGSLLGTSNAIDGSTLTGSPVLKTFTFATPVTINNATSYFFVVSRDGAADASNRYAFNAHTPNTDYSDGVGWSLNASWTSVNSDFIFLVEGTESVPTGDFFNLF